MSDPISLSKLLDPLDAEGQAELHARMRMQQDEDQRVRRQLNARDADAFRRSPAGMLADLLADRQRAKHPGTKPTTTDRPRPAPRPQPH